MRRIKQEKNLHLLYCTHQYRSLVLQFNRKKFSINGSQNYNRHLLKKIQHSIIFTRFIFYSHCTCVAKISNVNVGKNYYIFGENQQPINNIAVVLHVTLVKTISFHGFERGTKTYRESRIIIVLIAIKKRRKEKSGKTRIAPMFFASFPRQICGHCNVNSAAPSPIYRLSIDHSNSRCKIQSVRNPFIAHTRETKQFLRRRQKAEFCPGFEFPIVRRIRCSVGRSIFS